MRKAYYHVHDSDNVWKQAWGFTQIVLFEWTSDWGMSPGKPFSVLIGLIGVFALPYMFSLIGLNVDKKDGIWKVWTKDRLRQDLGNSEFEPLTCPSGLEIWRYGLYFSLL